MDGTLIDSLMIWEVIWSSFGKKYRNDPAFTPSLQDDKKVRTLTLKDAMELIHQNYGLANSGSELLTEANAILLDFYTNQVKLKDGVKEFLDYCSTNGTKMCIASATAPDLLTVALKHCGIEAYFSKIFSCGEIGKGKEHPDVFLMATEFLGTPVRETWLFEDSLVAIETATKIGMPTVGIYDAHNFGQDRIAEIASFYVAEGETLLKFINDSYSKGVSYHAS